MELKDTVTAMTSPDYKERFKAEYWQTRIRAERLSQMLDDHQAGELPFEPECPVGVLREQLTHMHRYLRCLGSRAAIEHIDLGEEL